MVEWFQERYVSREEHQNVVSYYKRLVVSLYGTVRELRVQADDRAKSVAVDSDPSMKNEHPILRPILDESYYSYNVVRVDFRRQRLRTVDGNQ